MGAKGRAAARCLLSVAGLWPLSGPSSCMAPSFLHRPTELTKPCLKPGVSKSLQDLECMPCCRSGIWLGGLPRDITEGEVDSVCSRHVRGRNSSVQSCLAVLRPRSRFRYGSVADINIKHSERDTFVFVTYGRLEHAQVCARCSNIQNKSVNHAYLAGCHQWA